MHSLGLKSVLATLPELVIIRCIYLISSESNAGIRVYICDHTHSSCIGFNSGRVICGTAGRTSIYIVITTLKT